LTRIALTIDKRIACVAIDKLAKGQDDLIWGIGAEGFLYYISLEKNIELATSSPIQERVSDLEFDRKGNLIIGGDFLNIIPVENFSNRDNYNTIDENIIKIETRYGIKNIDISGDGRPFYSTADWIIKEDDSFSNTGRRKIFQGRFYGLSCDSDSICWISGNEGLRKINLNGKELKIIGHPKHKLFTSASGNIILVANDELWVATNSVALYHLQFETIDSIPELDKYQIQSLYVDEENALWVASNNGVSKIYDVTVSPFQYSIDQWSLAEGLSSNNVKDVITKDDLIYVATDLGVDILKDTVFHTGDVTMPFRFTSISVNGTERDFDDLQDLPFDENDILIKYECLDFDDIPNIKFEYKLNGGNERWVETNEHQKEFSALSPGNYKFSVRRKGETEYEDISLDFIINEPWWRTNIARIALIFLLLSLVYLLIKIASVRIKAKSDEEARVQVKFAQLELNSLQSQMNPHFIFNALQSIQEFILDQDPRTANKYLTKFSKLMRLILESSRNRYVKIEDEIQLLRLYVDLEHLRFEDKFSYSINIDEQLSDIVLEVPSMLLQPFVENAINHGLVYKEEKGTLHIDIYLEGDQLYCIVEDDGIGRERAKQIKSESTLSYKSRGMQLIDERLRMLHIIGSDKIDIEFEDLYSTEGVGIGTKVEIRITVEN